MTQDIRFPDMITVRQHFESTPPVDIAHEVGQQVEALSLTSKVKHGATVAVGCSSRGIAHYDEIVKATVNALKNLGLEPFLIPAMGSHGAATAEGQQKVLALSGITEERMGAPVRSSLAVVEIGQTPQGVPVLVDRLAWQADHMVLVNRIKPHTEFSFDIESGVLKMMAIGLGKEKGATLYHKAFMSYGHGPMILSIADMILSSGRVLFGVGVVENGYSETAAVSVMPPETMITQEKSLLKQAYRLAPALPFDAVDVLIIDEMGKDISGCGFDAKVVGRIGMPLVSPEPPRPRVKRIVVCDLTTATGGNADGVGCADFITKRLADKIDFKALYVNAIAGSEPEHARIPMQMANDREAVQAAMGSIGLTPFEDQKVIRIKNTLQLQTAAVSQAFQPALNKRSDLAAVGPPTSMSFDADGNLKAFGGQ